ncbi:MAG: hypothetical protein AAFW84_35205, partial [Cyanobacteria bacterium J06635_15]
MDILVLGSALLIAALLNQNPEKHFAESGYITWFSFLKILAASYLAWKIFQTRKSIARVNSWFPSYNLWAILSFGFLFLGLDEILKIHENLDILIHDFFQICETAITDRIDSLIVFAYALIGINILFWAKSELKKFKPAFSLFSIAFALTLVMIFLDLLTDTHDFVYWLFDNHDLAHTVHSSLGIAEECFKVFAAGMFLAAFLRCLQISQENYGRYALSHDCQTAN